MAGTRTSPRQTVKANTSSPENSRSPVNAGAKRKADSVAGSSPRNKRGRNESKQQKTLEETMLVKDDDIYMKESEEASDGKVTFETEKNGTSRSISNNQADAKNDDDNAADNSKGDAADSSKGDAEDAEASMQQPAEADAEVEQLKKEAVPGNEESSVPANNQKGAVETDDKRELPSNILEKGIIYFFTRGRVGIEDPKSISDLQRSYLVLRPLPADSKLGDGTIQDFENNRLIAIPKKVLPKSHKDRFMVFVEKGKTTIKDLKENFFQGSEYETQTLGVRSTPPVSPVGEGVYALTTEGRNTHLAYMLTIPSELGEVQDDMGIRSKGSFLISLKNPTVSGPAYASLPQSPDFPNEVIEEFHGRSWMPPSKPSQLDYPNAQFLLIGEGDEGFHKAIEDPQTSNGEDNAAEEAIEELEHQDEIRIEHLHGDNTVFDDLGISMKEYSLATTW